MVQVPKRPLILLVCMLWCCFAPALAHAALPAWQQVAEQVAQAGEQLPGLRVLGQEGVVMRGVSFLEHLPAGSYACEAVMETGGVAFRYPLKLKDSEAGWRIVWAPDEAFTRRYVNVIKAKVFAPVPAHVPLWARAPRMPAMPVILTKHAIFTPFGELPLDRVRALDPALPGAAIAPPQAYPDHIKRWLSAYLEGEAGAVGVDLLADASVSWQDVNRVVFGGAGEGFYKIYLVGQGPDGALRAIESAAPVFDAIPGVKGTPPLTVGLFMDGAHGPGVRVGYRETDFGTGSCRPDRTLCVGGPEEFSKGLEGLMPKITGPKPAIALFATTGEMTLGQVLPWMSEVARIVGVPAQRVFMAFVSGGPTR